MQFKIAPHNFRPRNPNVVAKRRKKNKLGRQQRKVNNGVVRNKLREIV